MRLTKLEMLGFKSFADQTVMLFDEGVTAIVGPNGCGKSNVSDAVRWVLGEQRARILRGAKMEEVIFQGSSARRAVNVAEVSLVFENDSGALPVPFREVVVTRRLSRSGESEYLLNGASCRLRDIHDLMRGTGLGADCGVVIEQRMIDALLSDRPDDRRELFEEAAGVGLYRDRRRSSERRLEETGQDLARLDDLINEVQSQVRSLARQRRRAERHAELTARRFSVELTLASRDMHTWREELGALETQVADLREAAPTVERSVSDAERARDDMHGRRTTAEARRADLAQQVAAMRERVQALRGEIAVTEERRRNAAVQRSRAESEHRDGNAAETRLQSERARAANECAELQDALAAAQRELADRLSGESSAREDVGVARDALERLEQTARALRDHVQKHEIDREGTERELQELAGRARALDTEREEIATATEALGQALDGANQERDRTHARVEAASGLLERARAEARFARDHDTAMRADLGRTEDQFTALEGRVHGLEGLERERVGLAPAAARLLRERDRFGVDAILGPLSDFVSATATSAAVVERFLGMSVHAVLVRDRAVADDIREWHAATNPGPLLLLPLDSVPGVPWTDDADLLAGINASPEAVGWIHVLLEGVRALHDGGFVDARGAIWLPGSSAGPGPLRRRAELFALRADLAAAGEMRQAAMDAAEEARSALVAAEGAVAERAEEVAIAVDAHRHAVEALAELERRKGRCDRELVDAHSLTERLTSRADELVARRAELDVHHADARDALRRHDEQAIAVRHEFEATEQRADRAREWRTNAQVAVAQAEARLQVALEREQRIDVDRLSASQRLTNLEGELAALDELDRDLAAQMNARNMELRASGVTLADAEASLYAAERDVQQADDDFTAADHALDAARRHAQDRATELHHAELRYTELSGRRAAIRERLEAEWKRSVDDLLNSFAPIEMDDDALRAEAEALRQQLEGLGPVNPLAIEEHEEEVRRLEFLTLQRNDLNEAKNALQQAIREIDTTVRELFLTTFTQVRENFRLIFMTLFGGGECDLRLENPDAPLDCDIEIHASPRGKRTQRIHLLSSGERALVALSLLFGIFLTKPSPFCLLDEVDAPLDDANIGRFVRMLNEFKQKTQFIVITHNPRTTTEAADGVYGITMQEPGVSSVVSVRMRGSPVDDVVLDDMPSPEKRAAPAAVAIAEEVAATL